MLKENLFSSRLTLFGGGILIILLPFLVLACGEGVGNQSTVATNVTTGSSNSNSVSVGKPTVTQSQTPAQDTSQGTIASKVTTKAAISSKSGKAPNSGEEVCALLTKEQASTALGIGLDRTVPQSTTGFNCNYYAGENLLLQVFFEKDNGGKSLIDSHKFIYPDAKLISGVGDYNSWSAEFGRFELLQGSSNFDIVMLSGETDKTKLLDQATQVAQLVISQIK